jgi:hypothetical protein
LGIGAGSFAALPSKTPSTNQKGLRSANQKGQSVDKDGQRI